MVKAGDENKDGSLEYKRAWDILRETVRMELGGSRGAIWLREDVDKVLGWLHKAAEKGHTRAQGELGQWYYKNWASVWGGEMRQDVERAFFWFTKAAINGDGDGAAQYFLGDMYLKGLGTKQDSDLAMVWLERSAKQGCRKAQEALDKMKE